MGVLRIKDGLNEVLIRDPYDLFTVDTPQPTSRRTRGEMARAITVGLLFATAVAGVVFWQMQQRGSERTDDPFAYFEVKAIGADGRPVTGASVRSGSEELGVTDSFGEWRRFMRAHLGGTMVLTLTKKTENGTLKALKNLAIPMRLPANGELELKSRVLMRDAGAASVVDSRVTVDDQISAAQNQVSATAGNAAEPTQRRESVASAQTVANATAASAPEVMASPAPASEVPVVGDSSFTTVWVATSGQATTATRQVAEAMRQRLRELGVTLNAASQWQINLTDLAVQNPSGQPSHILKVEGRLAGPQGSERIYAFLRNYDDTPMATARAALWESSVHVAKPYAIERRGDTWYIGSTGTKLWQLSAGQTVYSKSGQPFAVEGEGPGAMRLVATDRRPCDNDTRCVVTSAGIDRAPPHSDWNKGRLTVLGDVVPGSTIYVGGYAVRKVEESTFEYWSNPKVPGIVTVEREGKVLHRLRLAGQRTGMAVLSLPSAPLSRR